MKSPARKGWKQIVTITMKKRSTFQSFKLIFKQTEKSSETFCGQMMRYEGEVKNHDCYWGQSCGDQVYDFTDLHFTWIVTWLVQSRVTSAVFFYQPSISELYKLHFTQTLRLKMVLKVEIFLQCTDKNFDNPHKPTQIEGTTCLKQYHEDFYMEKFWAKKQAFTVIFFVSFSILCTHFCLLVALMPK